MEFNSGFKGLTEFIPEIPERVSLSVGRDLSQGGCHRK